MFQPYMSHGLVYRLKDDFRPRRWPRTGIRDTRKEEYENLFIESVEVPRGYKEKRPKPDILTSPFVEMQDIQILSKARYWLLLPDEALPFAVVRKPRVEELTDVFETKQEYRVHIRIHRDGIPMTLQAIEAYMRNAKVSESAVEVTCNRHTYPLWLLLQQFNSETYWRQQFGNQRIWHAELSIWLPKL